MRIHYLSIIALLFIALILYSCVDEPTISEVKRPYSSVRLGNFSNNVAQINVEIVDSDGSTKSFSVSQNQLTEHFDIMSGARDVTVTNNGGEEIYSGNITMSAFEEITLLFTGYSAPGDEFNNTFADFSYTEGVVYIENGPDNADTAWIHCIDVISDTPDDTSNSFIVRTIDLDNPDADEMDAPDLVAFNTVQSFDLAAGNKQMLFLDEVVSGVEPVYDTLGVFDVNIEGGVRHYLFFTGKSEADGIIVVHDIETPLPVRNK